MFNCILSRFLENMFILNHDQTWIFFLTSKSKYSLPGLYCRNSCFNLKFSENPLQVHKITIKYKKQLNKSKYENNVTTCK